MAIKRLHYYDQQFLVEADFTDEQRYHLDMRRRLSRVLHGFGIAEGLDVRHTDTRQVTVKAGTAIDGTGRELVLEADHIVDLSNLTLFPPSTTVFVSIAYQETPTDDSTATSAPGKTRVTEAPIVQASTTAPLTDGTVVRLAKFDKTAGGDVPGLLNDVVDGGVRQFVSAKIAPGAIADVNLAAAAVTGAKIAPGTITAANLAAGAVSAASLADAAITGAKIAPGTITDANVAAATLTGAKIALGTITDANVAAATLTGAKIALGTITDANLAAATLSGAKIALGTIADANIAAGTISEAKLNAALAAKVNTPAGLVSVDSVSNPGGNVDLIQANAIQVTPNAALKTITIGENHSARTDNPHLTTAAQIGAFLSSQYEFGHRSLTAVSYNQTNASGVVRPFTVGFQPRMILAISSVSATLGARGYGGGSVGFFDVLAGGQSNNGFGITRFSDADWFVRGGAPANGICGAVFFDSGSIPVQGETLLVSAVATATGFTTTLTRSIINTNALASFQLVLNIYCWGV